jgi:hypothetical protein
MACGCQGGRQKMVITSQEAEAMRSAAALQQQQADEARRHQQALDAQAYERRLAEAMTQA